MKKLATVMLALVLTLLVPLSAVAKGGKMSEEFWQKHRAETARTFEKQKVEERREDQKRAKAASTIEQVRIFRLEGNNVRYGDPTKDEYEYGLGYSRPYFEAEKEVNSWLRKNPSAKIVRVVPASDVVIIFYKLEE